MAITPDFIGRDDLLAKVDHHPYARLTAGGDDVRGYALDGALAWTSLGPWGPIAASLGDAAPVVALFARLAADGALTAGSWLHLPRVTHAETAAALPADVHDDWDYLWTTGTPAPHPGEAGVVALDAADHDGIAAVLDDALPGSTSRPGDPRIRQWYGIRDGGRVVAVAGDRSPNGVGFLAGIAVAADAQGRGHGAALTTALTRRLVAEFGVSSLGVMSDNTRALALYHRLGYAESIARTSLRLA
ncbi:GNAT family N-acetyltransferase [Catellatospora sichuanensis]|uniref:GNAT family N-acetyltransferase n=1 Tax=Catellatospora sichuanensis TaxID=1969805 RepID=UPI0011843612|nr:GNAT family N-acetyltransferase [Catellatospora sichuanensis]